MAYSFAHRHGQSKRQIWGHFIWRVLALFAIGLFLNFLDWVLYSAPLRIPGVLQLIALSSLFAAPFVNLKPKWILLIAVIFLAAHSIILMGIGAPGVPAGSLQMGNTIDDYIDITIIGSPYLLTPNSDPEGILSLISSTAIVLLGLVVGRTLRIRGGTWETLIILLAFGMVLVGLGMLFSNSLPIIKQLWTSTFIMVSAGLAAIVFSLLYIWMDLLEHRKILDLGIPMGRNALIIYTLSIPFGMFLTWDFIYNGTGISSIYSIFVPYLQWFLGNSLGVLFYGILVVLFWWIVAYILYRRKIYIKL
jgi:predicted acyltransferase